MSTAPAHKASSDHGPEATRASASNVQAKLSVGKAGDNFEQEADRTADQVISGRAAGTGTPGQTVAPSISRLVTRKPQAKFSPESVQRRADKEEESQTQRKLQREAEEAEETQPGLQRQEEEKETAQPRLQRQEEEEETAQPSLQRQEEEEETAQPRLQRREEEKETAQPRLQCQEEEEETAQPRLQRQEEEEETAQPRLQRRAVGEEKKEKPLQAKSEPRANVRDKRQYPVLNQVEDRLFANKGRGEPLDDDTRRQMEAGFGADFSGVRVHTGHDAEIMSRDLKAQAFTHGKDVFFNSGKYEPDSLRGKTLLAHELTHVVQQGAAEQKLSAEKVQQNNARRDQPPPEPADEAARKAEQRAAKKSESPVQTAGPASAIEVTTAESPKPRGSGVEQAGEPAQEAEAREQPDRSTAAKEGGGKPKATGKKGKAKAKARGKGKAKGSGVGAFLRKMTEKVFQSKKAKFGELAANEKKKDPADEKLKQSESSVVPPAAEGQSRANAGQVATVAQAEAPQPDENQARQRFDQALEKAVPSTLEEVDKFKEAGKGRLVGEAVKGVVAADTEQVKATYQQVDTPPEPVPPETEPKALPDIEAAPETEAINPGDGVVGEVQPEHTDFSGFEKESDELLKQEGIAEEHLAMVDEGDLAEANKERKQLKTQVREGPAEVKAEEAKQKQQVSQELKKDELEGRQKMREKRQQALQGARGDQEKTKSKLELQRQQVTDHINGIYTQANDAVKQKLDDLEKQSLKDFDDGQAKATRDFEDNVKRRIDAFKRRRYDRIGGSLLWAKDKLFGMDELPEVAAIFESEKSRFITVIDGLVKTITAENKRVVQECREIVATARKEIETFVEGLGPKLRQTGTEAMKEMKGKLDALDKQINDKEKALQKKLAEKREAAIKAIEKKIEKMKEAMSGLISKLGNLLLDAMLKFFKWALKKAGYSPDQLMGVIDKGKAVIKKIVGDPIGFIKNIVTAVKNGIGLFQKNIKKHLIGGMMSWLTGAMADVPIQLPDKWDLKGILYLVLQVLGLTWDRIRTKLVKRIGEPAVRIAETSVDIVRRLITEGPIALWEMIKAKAAAIKQQVMEGIRNWAITQLVKQGIIKLVSFLNPAGAIVQAVLAIYNTIMFFVENWQRIVDFVKSVFNSIADIAMGRLSKAAQLIENAMGRTIPIILGFLARLLGLSGIGKAVSNIIRKIRRPIDKVVNKVIDKVVGLAKKLVGKTKAGAKAIAGKLIQWWKVKTRFKAKDGSNHTLFLKGTGESAKLTLRSEEQPYTRFLSWAQAQQKTPEQVTALGKAKQIAAKLDAEKRKPLGKGLSEPQKKAKSEAKKKAMEELLKQLQEQTAELFGSDLPRWQEPKYGGVNSAGFGTSMKAKILTRIEMPAGSSPTQAKHAVYDKLNKRRESGGSSYYIRGHLLNDNLGGPGQWKNMTPLTRKANKQHEGKVESLVKAAVRSGAIMEYNVKPVYAKKGGAFGLISELKKGRTPDDGKRFQAIVQSEDYVPSKLELNAHRLEKRGATDFKKVKSDSWTIENTVERTPGSYFLSGEKKVEPVKINILDDVSSLTAVGIPASAAQSILTAVKARKKKGKPGFGTYKTLAEESAGVTEAQLKSWNAQGYIRL